MSDPRFAELLQKYWAVAYQQGTEGRNHDDATGAAEGAEWDLMQYVKDLAKDRDYWKGEAEGERAKVEFRDKRLAEARDKALDEAALRIDCNCNERCLASHEGYCPKQNVAAIRALKEKPPHPACGNNVDKP